MNEKEHLKIVSFKLWKYGLLSLSAFLPPMFTIYFPQIVPLDETPATWFQRSGSLMVVLAAIAEYKLITMYDYFDLFNTKCTVPVDLPKMYNSMYLLVTKFSATAMILGTIIWGYGDVIYKII